jgi:hypothetical protein
MIWESLMACSLEGESMTPLGMRIVQNVSLGEDELRWVVPVNDLEEFKKYFSEEFGVNCLSVEVVSK